MSAQPVSLTAIRQQPLQDLITLCLEMPEIDSDLDPAILPDPADPGLIRLIRFDPFRSVSILDPLILQILQILQDRPFRSIMIPDYRLIIIIIVSVRRGEGGYLKGGKGGKGVPFWGPMGALPKAFFQMPVVLPNGNAMAWNKADKGKGSKRQGSQTNLKT